MLILLFFWHENMLTENKHGIYSGTVSQQIKFGSINARNYTLARSQVQGSRGTQLFETKLLAMFKIIFYI